MTGDDRRQDELIPVSVRTARTERVIAFCAARGAVGADGILCSLILPVGIEGPVTGLSEPNVHHIIARQTP